ncbi:uncharacterized protein TNCV_2432131 [Trichonephila clavipes]|nr:uncharacterized protein TNCV_2432131 [Trichonephila clavipes]
MSNADDSRRNWRNSEVLRRPSNSRNDYRGHYENGRGDHIHKDSGESFSRGNRRQGGRLNVLKVITAQGPKCQNVRIVELNVRIREFEKPWMFHVLADLEYPCILGVDFISGSQVVLDFDRKALAIPDSQIEKVVITIEEESVEIDLTKTGLEESQKK